MDTSTDIGKQAVGMLRAQMAQIEVQKVADFEVTSAVGTSGSINTGVRIEK